MMKKSLWDNTDQYEALLKLRNTPHQGTGQSPAKKKIKAKVYVNEHDFYHI